jgi:glucosylglycerate synthase
MPSLLSDELLRDVMAAGQTDVLVGLPTQNHADTAGAVARAVMSAFSGPFVRERTVLLKLDGGSTDGTPEVVRSAAIQQSGDIVSGQYALRTIHRITAPYHGLPGRGSAVRIIFTVAQLLRARAVFIPDPTAAALEVGDVAAWIGAVLAGGADYVKPAIPRSNGEGPLVTQIVRPLFRAACGARLLEPLDTQLACSGGFAASALAKDFWGLPDAEVGLDAYLTTHGLTGAFRLLQVGTAASAHVDAERRPRTSELFQQVIGAVFHALARSFDLWAGTKGSFEVAISGRVPIAPPRSSTFDLGSFTEAFGSGVDALVPLLASVLGPPLLERLRAVGRTTPIALDDELWVSIVFAFLRAAVQATFAPQELAQMLEPLYLGRVASFLNDIATGDAGEKLEQLAVVFEEQKPSLVGAVRSQEDDNEGHRVGAAGGGA